MNCKKGCNFKKKFKKTRTKTITLSELKTLFPNASHKTWHQHPNGSGWVENTATVDKTAYIEYDCLVCDHARVGGKSIVEDGAQVSGYAILGENCHISNGGKVSLGRWTKLIPVVNLRHTINPEGNKKIRIDEEVLSPQEWKNKLLQKLIINPSEIKEYETIISWMESWMELNPEQGKA